ncbi:diaminopimelate decarboxylase [Herbihabitans rhizosphaerae]|uniref:Diaminopimelate decarboxylase n=1 Tax=Herbihabitans rhizosphaerae TaxID=1872711 RepID=A0A4Q7KGN9_9PSEU|nr:diaminopimelate decarboxylase [Herbihabitans rhizosphaerae]RZS34423.1 diaminopimelate decarboxylase [Herbihabitans rhizosphaerae]
MTLADIVPTLRPALRGRLDDPGLWPTGTTIDAHGDLVLGGVRATELAARFGTPVDVLDEAQVRAACRAYRDALPGAEISYASKALLTRAVARWVTEEGCALDVCSAGEVAVAVRAGVPGERITLHGNAKTPDDLKAALRAGVGRIVIDSAGEIEQLAALVPGRQQVLIRVTPEVDAHTHTSITTGVADQKFGVLPSMLADVVRAVAARPNLALAGLHCHIGSQVRRPSDYETAARRMVALLAAVRDECGMTLGQLNLGGGQAVRYVTDDPEFDLAGYARRVTVAIAYECDRLRFPLPHLGIEPGRSIVARAGTTLYRVVSVKHGVRTFVAVDGGMSDNPRPALYGAPYTVRLVGRRSRTPDRRVAVVGRHCEAGDVLAGDVPLPGDVHPGDLLAVACTGAYHHSMASSYNLVGRPPLVAVGGGHANLLVRGETEDDLLARDVGA